MKDLNHDGEKFKFLKKKTIEKNCMLIKKFNGDENDSFKPIYIQR